MAEDTTANRRCEKCGKPLPDVRYAGDVKMWLCNGCWFYTPYRGPRTKITGE